MKKLLYIFFLFTCAYQAQGQTLKNRAQINAMLWSKRAVPSPTDVQNTFYSFYNFSDDNFGKISNAWPYSATINASDTLFMRSATNGLFYKILKSVLSGGGSGSVTSVSGTNANGVLFSIATPTTTPNITIALTDITPTTVNGNTIQSGTGTLKLNSYQLEAISDNKVLSSTNATHLDAGSAGSIPYQSNPGATTYLTPGTNGQVITWLSGVPTNTTLTTGGVSSVNISGGTTGLTFSGGPITTAGTFTTSGTLAIANGGTGQTTANAAFNALSPNTTRGDITVRNATVNARLALGASGTILRSDGTDLVYTTNTFPNTTGLDQILYATSANVIGSSANFKLGSNLTVLSPTGGVATGIVLTQSANNGTAANSYTSIDFNVPTTGLVGQFLSTASNYSAAGVNVAGNSLCLAAEAAAGQLALMATGASGYITFNTGGFGAGNERLRLLSTGQLGIGTTSPASKLDVEGNVAIGAAYSGTTAAPTNGLIVEGLVGMGVSSPSAKLHLAAATSSVTPSMRINPATGKLRSITSGSINFHESGELLEVVGADGWSEVIGAWGTPTISGGVGTPTYAVTSGSTDVNVKVEYTSSVSPVDDAVLFVITYERALHRAGTVSVCPRNRAAALTPIYIEETTTGFTVKLATHTADTPVWDQTRYWGFQVKN